MKKICACLLLSCGLTPLSYSDTLEIIYQQALNNDHEFKAAQATYAAGLEAKNIEKSRLLPRINGSISTTKSKAENDLSSTIPVEQFSEDEQGVFSQRQQQNPPTQTTNTYEYSVSINQPIIDLGLWNTYKSGQAANSRAEANFRQAEQDLIIRVAEAYFGALEAVDQLDTAKSEEKALSHQLEQTKQRFEVGLTAITEVHEAQARFDSSTASRLAAEGQLGIAFESLEVLTGRPTSVLSPLSEAFKVLPPSPAERKAWVDQAVATNFDLRASKHSADQARYQAKASKSQHLPTLNGSLSYSDRETKLGPVEQRTISGPNISLTLSVPIYSGGGVSATRRRDAANAAQAREVYLQTQRQIIQQARSNHLNVVTNVATVKARKQAITSSQSALDATKAGYDVGTRDLVDVLDAQRNLFIAKRDYFGALYDYVISMLNLKAVAGSLSERDVEELSQWLDTNKSVKRFQ